MKPWSEIRHRNLDEAKVAEYKTAMEREIELYRAFVAGFKTSGEGWNGEYMPRGTDIESEIEPEFRKWLAAQDGE